MPVRVILPYRAQYPDPIVIRRGETVALGQRDDEFPGWIWCTAADGRSGWVPEHFLSIEGTRGQTLRDYSAVELDVAEGMLVTVREEILGWALVETDRGSGWVPLSHLERA
jgi:hypothetical protein